MVGYLFGMSRVESQSQSSSSYWPKVWFGSAIHQFQILSQFLQLFLGLGFLIRIMKFNKISQNLQRRCPPCRCLHAQCSRTPLRSNFWIKILGPENCQPQKLEFSLLCFTKRIEKSENPFKIKKFPRINGSQKLI